MSDFVQFVVGEQLDIALLTTDTAVANEHHEWHHLTACIDRATDRRGAGREGRNGCLAPCYQGITHTQPDADVEGAPQLRGGAWQASVATHSSLPSRVRGSSFSFAVRVRW